MKSVVINGIEYCKYEIEGDVVYLNISKKLGISKQTEMELEEMLAKLIGMLEKTTVRRIAYLNIKG